MSMDGERVYDRFSVGVNSLFVRNDQRTVSSPQWDHYRQLVRLFGFRPRAVAFDSLSTGNRSVKDARHEWRPTFEDVSIKKKKRDVGFVSRKFRRAQICEWIIVKTNRSQPVAVVQGGVLVSSFTELAQLICVCASV